MRRPLDCSQGSYSSSPSACRGGVAWEPTACLRKLLHFCTIPATSAMFCRDRPSIKKEVRVPSDSLEVPVTPVPMTMNFRIPCLGLTTLLVVGCMNMPTPPSQITGAYTSSLKYDQHSCDTLAVESGSLARRENQLVVAQEQRVKTSNVQAFWRGYGQGDGVEASELANVRGETEAVRKAMDAKKCDKVAAKQ